ncbi:MAG: TonB-dependent receptor, partial [Rhodoglobus sp.]|nr:TonB-dependent receptor [Rhodoglobus sp.]
EVTIPAAELAILRAYDRNATDKRQLMGQSPYMMNFDLSYDGHRTGTAATISYNITGKRLDLVNFGPLPDVFEEPAPLLNLVVSQRLTDRWRLRLSGKNLLDADRRKTIGLDQGDLTYANSTRGRSYALSVTYLFD